VVGAVKPRSVVVTGASTGIGYGAARVLVERGFQVFGSVRTQADSDRLARELGASFTALRFDVTDEPAVHASAAQVREALGGEPLFGLVNNAGIAVPGPLLYLAIDELRHQLEVNVTGQLIVTQAFAPLLAAGRGPAGSASTPGRIIMISSLGGRNASPFIGPYNASKFALEGLSESLRRELILFGIDVIVIAPGAVATPIWDKADRLDVGRYADTPYAAPLGRMKSFMLEYGRKGLTEEALGVAIHKALTVARPRTRYVVAPDRLRNVLVSILPKRMVDRLIAKRFGLMPGQGLGAGAPR
jgi:NAD(P)-dependent dehydrogenase (short-subunit alcohol dehydrogenase family)